jgi:DNA-binding MarR family transcriptional regulator
MAFGRLRRLWESPGLRRRFHERMGVAIDPAIVRTLRAVATATDECGVGDVAEALNVDGSTASRLVDKAAALGYLARSGSERDRRRTMLSLTTTGADLQRRSLRVREELLAELTADLTDDDIDLLADLLERLARRLGDMEQHP